MKIEKNKMGVTILCILAALSILTSCGSNSGSNLSGKGNATGNGDAIDYSKYPKTTINGYEFDTAPVTLTAYIDSPKYSNGGWGDDYVSKWITEKTGVTIEEEYATTANSEELNLKLASGEELPDFIVADGYGNMAKTLVRQKFVLPLDELAKESFPDFLKLLPDKMLEVYSAEDGHLYNTADWFADTARIQKLITDSNGTVRMSGGNQTISINRQYWEAAGKPPVDTLEQLRDVLKTLHNQNPKVSLPFILASIKWGDSQDSVNLFYRLYGGQDWLYDDGTGNIKLCIRDPRYKQALQYMNNLYRDGIFNKETFTMAGDTLVASLSQANTFAYSGQDFSWFSYVTNGDKEGSVVLPIKAPMAAGLDRETQMSLKFTDIASVGGSAATFISINAKQKARAIQYLASRYTDEMQIAERFGIEGKSWEKDPTDGTIAWSQEFLDYKTENGFAAASDKYGVNNRVHSWFCTNYICKLESPKSDYFIRDYNYRINQKYLKNERIYDLTKIIKNDDIQTAYTQLKMVIDEGIIRCILSDTDAQFETEFARYITNAEKSKLNDIEKYFTSNYTAWKQKGF